MAKAKQKRRNKIPEETFTTSPAMLLGEKANIREIVNDTPKKSQRGCRSIKEDKTRTIWGKTS